jgi:hypothetical protein
MAGHVALTWPVPAGNSSFPQPAWASSLVGAPTLLGGLRRRGQPLRSGQPLRLG